MLFTPSVGVSGTAGGSPWAVKILRDDKSEASSIPLDVGATGPGGFQKTFTVRLLIPSDAPNGAIGTVALTATETTTGTQVTPGNDQALATVGLKIPDPVTTITATLANASAGASVVAGSVQFTKGVLGVLRFSMNTKEAGQHNLKVEARDDAGWTIDPGSVNLQPITGPGTFTITVAFTATGTVKASAIVLTITQVDKQLTVKYVQTVTTA